MEKQNLYNVFAIRNNLKVKFNINPCNIIDAMELKSSLKGIKSIDIDSREIICVNN